jgi:thiol-disulfide isomerase/thioredoxin
MINKIILSLVFSIIFFSGCIKEPDANEATLEIAIFDENMDYKIIQYDMVSSEETIYHPDTLEGANLKFSIFISEPTCMALQINNQYTPLYLEPGYTFSIDQPIVTGTSITFSGNGAEINSLNTQFSLLLEFFNPRQYYDLELSEFQDLVQNIDQKADSIYAQSNQIDNSIISFYLFKTKLMTRILSYIISNYNLYDETVDVPEIFNNDLHSVKKYTPLIETGAIDFSIMLDFYFLTFIRPAVYKSINPKSDSIETELPRKVDDYLRNLEIENQLKELLIAKNIYRCLKEDGINDTTTDVYNRFNNSYPNSRYLPALVNKYAELMGLTAGSLTPSVLMVDPNDEVALLSETKGKLVYLDIWATWCKPCISSFQHYENLIRDFSGNEVEFIFLSVDNQPDKWKQFIAGRKVPDGKHFIEKDKGAVYDAFKIYGIPRYIVIGRDGRIIDANAPRPGSTEIKELLSKYIVNN